MNLRGGMLFSCSVMSISLQSHGLQHTRPPCPCILEFAQTQVQEVSDAIQPSHPLSSLSPPAFSLSQHQGFFQWVSSSHQVTEVLELPMNIQGWFPLGLSGLISLQSKGLWRVFSSTAAQKNQFFGTQPSLWSNSHIRTWLLEKPEYGGINWETSLASSSQALLWSCLITDDFSSARRLYDRGESLTFPVSSLFHL